MAGHPDLLDCLIVGTKIEIDGYFLTEDKALTSILPKDEANLDIEIKKWKNIRKNIIFDQ